MLTQEMLDSIKKVEATRPSRIGADLRRMDADEKHNLLRQYHPDYKESGFSTLVMGPNKGEKVPVELGELLQANSRLLGVDLDLNQIDYDVDVLVIGGGGAGASAAIEAHKGGANVMIATKLRIGDANTMMAEGGIQAADKENDSPQRHFLDAFGGGHYAAKPELLKKLVMEAPEAIQWLNDLGVMFDKNPDGTMVTTHGGGTSRKRMHACADYSGAEIMRVLRDEVINRGITVVDFTSAVELILDDKGQVAGAVLQNMETGEYLVARPKVVIIATGGPGMVKAAYSAGLPGIPHLQPLRRHCRRPGAWLPRGRAPAVPGYHPVPSHRRGLPGAALRRSGDGEGAFRWRYAGELRRRGVHAPLRDPRRGGGFHYPGVFGPRQGRSHPGRRLRRMAGHPHDRDDPWKGNH